MVVAALVHQFAPAHRGVFRKASTKQFDNSYSSPPPPPMSPTAARGPRHSITNDASDRSLYSAPSRDAVLSARKRVSFRNSTIYPQGQTSTSVSLKSPYKFKKRFRAMSALTSIASDFDLITDWIFYYMTLRNEIQLEQTGENLIPRTILNLLLLFCITGTLSWLMLATDGRVVTPILRRFGIPGISTGAMLLFCVLAEDLPQVVLTFLVEDYYDDSAGDASQLSGYAVMNLMTSLYDVLIKLAEAYDERHDVVETGLWCKGSFRGHERSVNAVVALPTPPPEINPLLGESDRSMSFIQDGKKDPDSSALPLFLTASKDKTARLWRPSDKEPTFSLPVQNRWSCVVPKSIKTQKKSDGETLRVYSGHTDAVTSIAILGTNLSHANLHYDHGGPFKVLRDEEEEKNVFFVTGSLDGTAKLWHLSSVNSIRTFSHPDAVQDVPSASFREVVIERTRTALSQVSSGKRSQDGAAVMAVVCLDDISGTEFVCGYRDATIRLWDAWSGECLCVYRGHEKTVHSLCAMGDSYRIVSGSKDKTIKVWDTSRAMDASMSSISYISSNETIHKSNSLKSKRDYFKKSKGNCSQNISFGLVAWSEDGSDVSRNHSMDSGECCMTLEGHTAAVLSVATVQTGKTVISGSADRTARLWCIDSGLCLRIFHGHLGGINGVSALDETMILTASSDRTIKLWAANPGGNNDEKTACLRTYAEHKNEVTCVTHCHDGRTFVTGARDRLAKIWNVTTATLPPTLQEAMEDHEGIFGADVG